MDNQMKIETYIHTARIKYNYHITHEVQIQAEQTEKLYFG